jgi:RimJ/RimL family protein N-acetyltransferase
MTELPFPDPPLRTGEIWLRPWRQDEATAVVTACSDDATARFIPDIPVPYAEADARQWLASREPDRLAGRELTLAIADTRSDEPLGAIAARVDPDRRSANVGYWLTPSARGRGHMTGAMRLFCAWLIQTFGLGRIELTTDPENLASQRVAQRCGFQREGHLRAHLYDPRTGDRRDSLIWGLVPDELVRG